MYTFLNKYGQALAFGLGVLITIIFLANIFSAPDSTFELLNANDKTEESYATDIFNFGIGISVILVGLAFVIALIFGVFSIISNPKGSVKGLIGIAILAVIVFIGYSTADGDLAAQSAEITNAIEKFETSNETEFTGGNLKFISGAIIAALVMIGLAILSLIVFGIRGLFK